MFIRYVRNRHSQVRRRRHFYKPAAVCLIFVILVSFFNMVICKATGMNSSFEWAAEKICDITGKGAVSLYRFIATQEYNAFLYTGSLNGEKGKDAALEIMDAINRQSNLYAYVDEIATEISLTYYDPSYTTEEFSGTIVSDNGGSEEIQEQTTTEIQIASEPESGDGNAAQVSENPGYVIPAVSDAGIVYSMEQLSDFDFLMSKLYTVPERAKVLESELVAEEMLAEDMTLKTDNSKPQILIYHTHSQEGFVDSVQGDDSTSIVAVGAYLAKILSEVYGYNVIHCTEHFDIKGGSLDRSKAYTYAEYTVEQILQDNPSIEVVLDIHRDGLKEGADKLVTNINGKDTAKIMFFNGVSRSSESGDIDYLYNRYKKDNLAFSFQLKLMALQCYPDFTRRNYIDAYQYNLHLRPKSVLIEVGAQNNTLQEELNAMEVLAEVLHRVIQ